MTKIARNARCPCGSGKKYKRCCLSKEAETTHPTRSALAGQPTFAPGHVEETDLDALSNSVVDLISENRLDEAEKACSRLLEEFPDCVDGIERLVAVHEAKGNFDLAAEYARQTVAFMEANEGDYDPELIADFAEEERALRQRHAEQSAQRDTEGRAR